jgi:hypothetical protein
MLLLLPRLCLAECADLMHARVQRTERSRHAVYTHHTLDHRTRRPTACCYDTHSRTMMTMQRLVCGAVEHIQETTCLMVRRGGETLVRLLDRFDC